MPELTIADVKAFAANRPMGTDAEIQRMLDAALVVGRRYTGWHVSPAQDQTVTLDGPDSRILWLPTLKLNTLTSVVEDGVTLDVTPVTGNVVVSAGDGPGLPRRVALRKRGRSYWSCEYGAVVAVINHGFTEAEAADWRQAILSMVDQMSLLPVQAATGSSGFGIRSEKIDDVAVGYAPYAAMAEEVLFSVMHILDDYRLPSLEFL